MVARDALAHRCERHTFNHVCVENNDLGLVKSVADCRRIRGIAYVDFQTKPRQRFRQDCAVAIFRVDHRRIYSAEILTKASCHLTTLKLGGRIPAPLDSCQTK